MAFLLIRLKKYLNPHENSYSKVISILITGNSLHESSSAPQQHKSVQYKWFALFLHQDVSHTDMLQPHFISCRGVSGGRRQHARIQEFCQFYLVLSLFYSLKRGSNGFIAEKTILILYNGSRGGPLFSWGGEGRGCPAFFQGGGGPNAYFYRNTYMYLLFSRGSVWTPYPPLDPHMGNVIITGQYLSQALICQD